MVRSGLFSTGPLNERQELRLTGLNFIVCGDAGGNVNRPETSRFARHDAKQLRWHAVRRKQIVTRHVLDIEILVLRGDFRHENQIGCRLCCLAVSRRRFFANSPILADAGGCGDKLRYHGKPAAALRGVPPYPLPARARLTPRRRLSPRLGSFRMKAFAHWVFLRAPGN
jgi:hypothetical protein